MTYKGLVLILSISLFSQSAYNQENHKDKPEEDIHFIKKRGYSVDACYRMAEDYLRSNTDQYKAIPYLEYIIEKETPPRPNVYHMLARAFYYHGNFNRALLTLTEYIEKEKDKYLVKQAKAELEQFKTAAKVASVPINAVLVNSGPNINSKYAEINPFISKNEDLLVYSSNRSKNFNIYVSKKPANQTNWLKSKLAGNYINTQNDEFVAGLSPSGKNLMVHYNQVSGFEDINISSRTKGIYRELADPGQTINSTYREEGACMTEDGDTLYFASDRPGGFGGFDLYYSLRLPDGTYGLPINMGESVNTKFDDNYPNLAPDGKKLYFASKGHNSIGGYDLFYTSFNPEIDKWTLPVNPGYPLNNAFDNKSIAFASDPRYAYISTIARPSYGDYDIYKVIFLDVEPGYLIIRAEVFTFDNETEIPVNSETFHSEITVYQDNEIYGQYAFDRRSNSYILALVPGMYILELEAEGYKTCWKKISIDENFYKRNLKSLKIYLEKVKIEKSEVAE